MILHQWYTLAKSCRQQLVAKVWLSCPRWAAKHQRHFGDSNDIKDVFQDDVNLVEFLISAGHLPPQLGTARQACHDDDNNNNDINKTAA